MNRMVKGVICQTVIGIEESDGVKFWGFGKTVYQELLSIIADPDYGDISDSTTGRDIVVERQTPAEAGNQYGKTTIRVKPIKQHSPMILIYFRNFWTIKLI